MSTDAQFFSGLPVRNLAVALDWYATFFGRPADEIVGDEAMWQVSGSTWVFVAPDAARAELGGQNLAPRPMEAVLAGAGGCTAYDVVLILQRGRHDVRGCTVRLTSERAAQDPKVFTRIDMHFTVTGKGIPAAAVERAIALSHEKYCSASIMLGKTAEITTSFALIDAA